MNKAIKDVLDTKQLTDLEKVSPVMKEKKTSMTKTKIEEAIKLLKEVEENNGYVKIAERVELDFEQVKEIHLAMFERISELQPIESKSIE